jgi:hypothetical protein
LAYTCWCAKNIPSLNQNRRYIRHTFPFSRLLFLKTNKRIKLLMPQRNMASVKMGALGGERGEKLGTDSNLLSYQ